MTVAVYLELPVKKTIHPVQVLWFVDYLMAHTHTHTHTHTGVLVDKGTYGPCIKAGDPLWSTGNSLSEKLLNSLVSAVAA